MAYIHRLIFFTLFLSINAFAASPLVRWELNAGASPYFPTMDAACDAYIPYGLQPDDVLVSSECFLANVNSAYLKIFVTNAGQSLQRGQFEAANRRFYCATSPTVNVDENTVCDELPPPTCVAGEGPSGYLATNSCLAGCTHVWTGQNVKIGEVTYGSYLGKTGGQCSTSGTSLMNKGDVDAAMKAADDKAAADAAAAKAAADAKNVSDKAAAAAAAADAKAKSDKAASDKAASHKAEADAKAAADKAAADAADPSKTDEQKAASAGASSAATAAATAAKSAADAAQAAAAAATGAAAAAALPDAPPEFCSLHPTSIICKNSTINAGACSGHTASSFSCSGDAIQCQIAKQQVDEYCANISDDDTSKLGAKVLDGTADLGGTDTFATPREVSIGSIDETSWLPKGCLPDMTFAIVGQSIVLPLSRLCEGLQTAGKIVKAFAFMIAARIIFS